MLQTVALHDADNVVRGRALHGLCVVVLSHLLNRRHERCVVRECVGEGLCVRYTWVNVAQCAMCAFSQDVHPCVVLWMWARCFSSPHVPCRD